MFFLLLILYTTEASFKQQIIIYSWTILSYLQPRCSYDNLFTEDRNYHFFIEKFKKHALPVFRCYAYVLMPNHFHFFVSVRTEAELLFHAGEKIDTNEAITFSYYVSQQWSNFLNAYAKAFNKANHRAGALFRQSTPRKILNGNDNITSLINYVHFNPVKHGFASACKDWKYSSIHELTNTEEPTFLERDWIIEWFGNIEEFKKFHITQAETPNSFENL